MTISARPWLQTTRTRDENRDAARRLSDRCCVSFADGRKKGDVCPEELSKCWKLPSAASIVDLPPTLPILKPRRERERERERESISPAAVAVDGATKARWLN